jgi:hypothetical protein
MVWGLLRLEHEQLEVLGYPEGCFEYSLSSASEIKSFDKVKRTILPLYHEDLHLFFDFSQLS